MPRTDSGSPPPSDDDTRRRSNTRAKLVAAAERLFIERGSADVSIAEICAEAGFTRGAFYSNYDTATSLFFEVYEQHTAAFLDQLERTPPTVEGPESLEASMAAILRAIPNEFSWYLLRASFSASSADDPEITTKLHRGSERLRVGLEPFIEAAARRAGREFRIDPADAVDAVISAHMGAVFHGRAVDDPERLRLQTVTAALLGTTRKIPDRATV